MLIQVGFSWAKLAHATVEETAWVESYLTFKSDSYAQGQTEESLLVSGRMFPAGLAARVARAARESGHTVEVVHREPTLRPHTTMPIDRLWPHQAEAWRRSLEARRGIVQHATGAGKGTLIVYTAEAILQGEVPGPVLVIVTSRKLLTEMRGRFMAEMDRRVSLLGAGFHDNPHRATVLVTTVPSILTHKNFPYERWKAVLPDEIHGGAAEGYRTVLHRLTNAEFRVGYSATPKSRHDRKTLHIYGALGEVIHTFSPTKAAEAGVTAEARITLETILHPAHSVAGGYTAWERRALARNTPRNKAAAVVARDAAKPALLFVRTEEHQTALMEALKDAGVTAVAVNGKRMGVSECNRAVKQLVRGDVEVLVSTPLFRQGVDIPEVRTVINAAGGMSVIDVIQKVGRGSRRHQRDGSTKDHFDVVDFWDMGCGCNGEHASCRWLAKHSAARLKAYETFGFKVKR